MRGDRKRSCEEVGRWGGEEVGSGVRRMGG
jgi:hypothetical protein